MSLGISFILTLVAIGWSVGTLIDHHSKDSDIKDFTGMVVLWSISCFFFLLAVSVNGLDNWSESIKIRSIYDQFTQEINTINQATVNELRTVIIDLVNSNQRPSAQDIESVQDRGFSPVIRREILSAARIDQPQELEEPLELQAIELPASSFACCARLFLFSSVAGHGEVNEVVAEAEVVISP